MKSPWHLPFIAACASGVIVACSAKRGGDATPVDSTAVAVSTTGGSATGAPSPSSMPAAQSPSLPKSVTMAGEHGEDLYDAVAASNWPSSRAILDSLDRSAQSLPNDSVIAVERAALLATLDSLHRAVAGRQRAAARELANRITYYTSMMTAPYNPVTPAEVLLLDYDGREIEIWSSQQDQAKLTRTVDSIRKTWSAVRPSVASHGGTAAAATMDHIVTRLGSAKSPRAYAALAKPFLDQVDELEKVFATP